jgi:hypothetical protein
LHRRQERRLDTASDWAQNIAIAGKDPLGVGG